MLLGIKHFENPESERCFELLFSFLISRGLNMSGAMYCKYVWVLFLSTWLKEMYKFYAVSIICFFKSFDSLWLQNCSHLFSVDKHFRSINRWEINDLEYSLYFSQHRWCWTPSTLIVEQLVTFSKNIIMRIISQARMNQPILLFELFVHHYIYF